MPSKPKKGGGGDYNHNRMRHTLSPAEKRCRRLNKYLPLRSGHVVDVVESEGVCAVGSSGADNAPVLQSLNGGRTNVRHIDTDVAAGEGTAKALDYGCHDIDVLPERSYICWRLASRRVPSTAQPSRMPKRKQETVLLL